MNTRRRVVAVLGSGILAGPLAVWAQPKGRVWRIGFLGLESAAGYARELDAFRGGLKDFGYIEGKNIVIVYRWAEGVIERLPGLAGELLREKVDIVVTHAGAGPRAAQRATTTVPIVIASLGNDPVSMGLVKTLARPGGNITGLVSLSGNLGVKQLEAIKDLLPSARRVAFMISPTAPGGETVSSMQVAARALKLDLELVQPSDANEFEPAILGIAGRGVDALIVHNAPFFIAYYDRIALLATRNRIPLLGAVRLADSGGLIGYGTNILNNFRRAAYFVDRIFKGTKPADLPIEQPMHIELVVNLKTAKALGIRIPDIVMVRADRVIQ